MRQWSRSARGVKGGTLDARLQTGRFGVRTGRVGAWGPRLLVILLSAPLMTMFAPSIATAAGVPPAPPAPTASDSPGAALAPAGPGPAVAQAASSQWQSSRNRALQSPQNGPCGGAPAVGGDPAGCAEGGMPSSTAGSDTAAAGPDTAAGDRSAPGPAQPAPPGLSSPPAPAVAPPAPAVAPPAPAAAPAGPAAAPPDPAVTAPAPPAPPSPPPAAAALATAPPPPASPGPSRRARVRRLRTDPAQPPDPQPGSRRGSSAARRPRSPMVATHQPTDRGSSGPPKPTPERRRREPAVEPARSRATLSQHEGWATADPGPATSPVARGRRSSHGAPHRRTVNPTPGHQRAVVAVPAAPDRPATSGSTGSAVAAGGGGSPAGGAALIAAAITFWISVALLRGRVDVTRLAPVSALLGGRLERPG